MALVSCSKFTFETHFILKPINWTPKLGKDYMLRQKMKLLVADKNSKKKNRYKDL